MADACVATDFYEAMMSSTPSVADGATQSVGFLLLDKFTLMSLASAVEPLRMANQLTGRTLYRWHTFSPNGAAVWASDGVPITCLSGTR